MKDETKLCEVSKAYADSKPTQYATLKVYYHPYAPLRHRWVVDFGIKGTDKFDIPNIGLGPTKNQALLFASLFFRNFVSVAESRVEKNPPEEESIELALKDESVVVWDSRPWPGETDFVCSVKKRGRSRGVMHLATGVLPKSAEVKVLCSGEVATARDYVIRCGKDTPNLNTERVCKKCLAALGKLLG